MERNDYSADFFVGCRNLNLGFVSMKKIASRTLKPSGRPHFEVPNLLEVKIPNGDGVDLEKAFSGYNSLGHISRPLSIPKFEHI